MTLTTRTQLRRFQLWLHYGTVAVLVIPLAVRVLEKLP